MDFPAELKYTKMHEWVRVEGEVATVGVTDHAQSELGDIVYVELPEAGRVLQQEESFGVVESVKTVSDLYAPIGGEVIETNGSLAAQSELLNTDPYGDGWMVKIKIGEPGQAEALMGAEAYQASLDD